LASSSLTSLTILRFLIPCLLLSCRSDSPLPSATSPAKGLTAPAAKRARDAIAPCRWLVRQKKGIRWGYPEFRSAYVLAIVGQSLFYLLSRSALAPLISHVAMHITAVLVGVHTFSQLPPHY
jgi:hypothetical protein